MKSIFKITQQMLKHIHKDLQRPHQFAYERVGFVTCRFALTSNSDLLVLAHDYYVVADEDYVEDQRYGALIGSGAFRMAMQLAYSQNVGVFHIHLHLHKGSPIPSRIDLQETRKFVPDFFHVRPNLHHGALILSIDSISGRIWHSSSDHAHPINQFIFIGAPFSRVKV